MPSSVSSPVPAARARPVRYPGLPGRSV